MEWELFLIFLLFAYFSKCTFFVNNLHYLMKIFLCFSWLYHRSKVDAKHEAESKKDVEAQDKKAGIDNVNYLDDKGNAIEMSRL